MLAVMLLHNSALPTSIAYGNNSYTLGDDKTSLHYEFPEFIITTRGSVVKQIEPNMFAGLSVVYNYTKIGDADLSFRNQKWLARLYFGFRL